MPGINCKLLIALICLHTVLHAQVYIPLNVQHAVKSHTRTLTGEPGSAYWQNRGDYQMKITFNPKTRLLEGSEVITYFNNSPDTLDRLVINLYPDYYKKGTLRLWSIDPEDENDGVVIKKISINDKNDVQAYNYQTNYIALPSAFILPHTKSTVRIEWSYTVNAGSPNRTGLVDKTTFFMAYTFPRIAVYDDIDGWNMQSYNGLQEFYNDFGNFDADITVPKNYVVWATGELLNPEAVFTKPVQANLSRVMQSDSIIYIISRADADNKKITLQNKLNTFRFHAENVTDFAFALSDHYVWQSSSLNVSPGTKTKERRVRIDAVYNPIHKDYEMVAGIAHRSIDIMSNHFPAVPFPYPHETVFDGLDQMEYPMMVNDNPVDELDPLPLVNLTSHEIFHTYFPFYMGINETKYAWMDEGWATAGAYVISPLILGDTLHSDHLGEGYERTAGAEIDLPLITLSTQMNQEAYWTESYGKPALTFLYLRDLLGDDLFFKGLHYYMDEWNGKHSTPYDYFNCMSTASGKNLTWFFNAWFYQPGYPDIAIENVIEEKRGNAVIVLVNKGNKPVPADAVITFTDGSVKTIHNTAAIWENNNIFYLTIPVTSAIKKVELNTAVIPDVDRTNNIWMR